MSSKKDIIEGNSAKTARGGLVYTCKCGWIDLGHARADGVRDSLWLKITEESGTKSKDKKGFKLTYAQTMRDINFGSRDYYVPYGLSKSQKESVALSIFLEVSLGFESIQDNYFWWWSNSGFSAEDLVSDLIGFYRAVKPGFDYINECQPVSKNAAIEVWETFGEVGKNKNKSFNPFIYPCKECKNNFSGPGCSEIPAIFNTIKPAKKGKDFRDWSTLSDSLSFRF